MSYSLERGRRYLFIDHGGSKHWGTVHDFDLQGVDLIGLIYENRGEEGCFRTLGEAPFRLEWRFLRFIGELRQ